MENKDSSVVKLYLWEFSVAAVTDVGQRGVTFLTGAAAKSLNVEQHKENNVFKCIDVYLFKQLFQMHWHISWYIHSFNFTTFYFYPVLQICRVMSGKITSIHTSWNVSLRCMTCSNKKKRKYQFTKEKFFTKIITSGYFRLTWTTDLLYHSRCTSGW